MQSIGVVPMDSAERGQLNVLDALPVERAAAHDGIYPIEVDIAQVGQILELVRQLRGSLEGFDVALTAHPGVSLSDLKLVGATWAMHAFWPGHRPDQVMRFISRGVPTTYGCIPEVPEHPTAGSDRGHPRIVLTV